MTKDEDKIELLEDNLHVERRAKEGTERRYQWAITTLIGLLCLSIGFGIQAERNTKQVTINTVRLDQLERQFEKIDAKLNILLANAPTKGR